MNERIKELYEQSLIRETGKDHAGNPMLVIKQNPEKFAELIVKECILTIQMGITRDGPNTEKYLRSIKHITQIKEHFGVEE